MPRDPNGKICLRKYHAGNQSLTLRTANNLKNKFYTILRNLIKLIFRKNPVSCPRVSGEISSKDLCRLYDGREGNLVDYDSISRV